MRRLTLVMLALLLALLFSCDSRNGSHSRPEMTAQFAATSVFNQANYNTVELQIWLSGSAEQINERKVLLSYDSSTGVFTGAEGNSNAYWLHTDTTGYAHGTFVVHAGYSGTVVMTCTLEDDSSVSQTIVLNVYDLPTLNSYTATPDTLLYDGTSTAQLRFALDGDGRAGLTVNFSLSNTNMGSLAPASAITDSMGVANCVYTAGWVPGEVLVTARVPAAGITRSVSIYLPQRK